MPRVVAYARVSTDKQDADNQRFELERFADENHLTISEWLTQLPARGGDVLLIRSFDDLPGDFLSVLKMMDDMLSHETEVHVVSSRIRLADDHTSQVAVAVHLFPRMLREYGSEVTAPSVLPTDEEMPVVSTSEQTGPEA